jgi:outer membrane protein assembly factor BamB
MPRGVRKSIWLVTAFVAGGVTLLVSVPGAQAPRRPAQPQATKPQPPKPAAPAATPAPGEPWLTWGGPRKDFTVTTTGLATTWPAEGPPRVWSRTLGDGYSGMAVENGILYTAYRRGADDVIVALDAASGKTLWEAAYAAPFTNAYPELVGPGPYAMPQIVGDRLIVASGIGHVRSLDKRTGKSVWAHDLYTEFTANKLPFGYSNHALPYKDTLIVLAGGGGLWTRMTGRGASGVLAFRQRDGSVAWQGLTIENAHSSPLLINVDGQPQVVALLAQEVIGFSPDSGELLWRHPHPTGNGLAISTPLWGPDNILFVSSAYSGGARGLQLRQANGKTEVRELWHNPRVQAHFVTLIRLGDHVVVSSGHSGPAFMTAVNIRTGALAWQQRGLAKAQLLHADGKLVILDEDGTLALATATPQKFEILAQTPLLKKVSWTPPTMVGTRLYVRDRATIMALELGAQPPATK